MTTRRSRASYPRPSRSDDPSLRHIPVIAIPADRHAPVRGMDLTAFLPKPIDVPRLLASAQVARAS